MRTEKCQYRTEEILYNVTLSSLKRVLKRPSNIDLVLSKTTVTFSPKLVTTFGQAVYHNGEFTVSYNPVLWAKASDKQKRQVVIHEMMHVVAYMMKGDFTHGKFWKSLMVKAKAAPEMYHDVNVGDRNGQGNLSICC